MALEDFEKELAAEAARSESKHKRSRSHDRDRDRDSKRHHRHHHHRERSDKDEHRSRHRDKRSRHSERGDRDDKERRETREKLEEPERKETSAQDDDEEDDWVEKEADTAPPGESLLDESVDDPVAASRKPALQQRDNWMEAPSAMDIDYVHRKQKQEAPSQHVKAVEKDYQLKIHEKELNHHLRNLRQGEESEAVENKALLGPATHEVTYAFGDAGASWRMTKLNAVYRQAKESGRKIEAVAVERFGDLRAFDDAREEEIELDRRKMYGKDYVGKEKPSGELYQERKLDADVGRIDVPNEDESEDEFELAQGQVSKEKPSPTTTVALDQTSLNKLKAQMMKAKLRKAPEAAKLEEEYNVAMLASSSGQVGGVVVLNKMESRMLDRTVGGEVKAITNKRGQERGLVVENEDMSIEDMVKHERRTKHGNEGKAFAERIAKDGKFDNDLDYLDENANKLAASVQKSAINLRSTAISDYQKTRRMLDACPLCYHEDTTPPTPPLAPVVSLATRTFLTLPTSPEITPHGLCASIVPTQHRLNLLECDDDEWEEMRNFMKSLTRFYYSLKPRMGVIFYENAAHDGRKRHASLEAVPLPLKYAEQAPAFFKEAILAADEEWTQHKKIINTLSNANEKGWGKNAFRRSMVSELPYFHVWFQLDGGLGHVVEDVRRWPKGDLFARELIGGMMDVPAEIVKRQGRWKRGDAEMQDRVEKFVKGWRQWDWTKALVEDG